MGRGGQSRRALAGERHAEGRPDARGRTQWTIARRSDDVLQVEQGSLYPALQRLEDRGWIESYWGTSDSNRRARFYKLTSAGKKHLLAEATRWEQLARAVKRVMRPV